MVMTRVAHVGYPPKDRGKMIFQLNFFEICLLTAEDINEQAGSQDDRKKEHSMTSK